MPSDSDVTITLIVARARNGVIGNDNQLPWHLSEELRQFKAVTMGHALIMGRHTFESIGRPLPGRRIVVVTRNKQWQHAGCVRAADLPDALIKAQQDDPILTNRDEIFIAGGAQLYDAARVLATRMRITQVELEPLGDVFFAAPDLAEWTLVDATDHTSQSGVRYQVQDWRRKQ